MIPETSLFLKKSIKDFLFNRGYVITKNQELRTPILHVYLRYILKKYDIQCVLDVGAKIGRYRHQLRNHINYKGHIISFEPIKELVEILQRKAKDDREWTIAPYALGADNGERDLNIMKEYGFSSFYSPSADQLGMQGNVVVGRERVTVKRLDDALADLGVETKTTPTFLKMDTQGYDLEVLKGAERILPNIVGLQSEVSVLQLYDGMPNFCESISAMNELGFDIAGFAPVSTHSDRVVEFDCVLINRRTALARNAEKP